MRIWRKPYTVRHFTPGKVSRGYASSGYTDAVAELDVQPLSTKELEALPEGQRSKRRVKTFGDYPMQTANQATSVKGDRLFFEGRWYECEVSEPWNQTKLGHYFAQFVEVPENEKEAAPTAKKAKKGGDEG